MRTITKSEATCKRLVRVNRLYRRLIKRGDVDLEYRAYLVLLQIQHRLDPPSPPNGFASWAAYFYDRQQSARQTSKRIGKLRYECRQFEIDQAAKRQLENDSLSALDQDLKDVRDGLIIPVRVDPSAADYPNWLPF